MKADKIFVLILCVAAAIGVILYEIVRVRKKHKDDVIIPLEAYDGYKFFYILSIVFAAIAYFTYFSNNQQVQWEYVVTATIQFLGAKFGRRLDIYTAKLDESNELMSKRIKIINQYHRKHS
jgi:hypothetical protein